MKNRDFYYFSIAEKASLLSDYPRVKIGAVIVKKNKIISFGCNQTKTHPIQAKHNHSRGFKVSKDCIHAEASAVIHTNYDDIRGCNIYVFRKDLNGNLSMCRPCKACMEILKSRKIKYIFYTTPDGYCKERIIY